MSPEPGTPTLASRPAVLSAAEDSAGALVAAVVAQVSLATAVHVLSTGLSRIVKSPLAVLSKNGHGWQFEAEGFPDDVRLSPSLLGTSTALARTDPAQQVAQQSGVPWTAIDLGPAGGREWLLLAPGTSATWGARPGFDNLVERLGRGLAQVANKEHDAYVRRFGRRLHVFSHRLARTDQGGLHAIVLRTLAAQVGARTGALATYNEQDQGIAIVATQGYPISLVEHVRIAPGEGVIGRAYQSGRPLLGHADEQGASRRLRYRTSSFIILPVVAGDHRLAVVALTDRSDGRAFDARDFAAARILAASAAPALTRERLAQNVDDLTRLATVDAVTGLFNRRYFESRLLAEVERARRQQQELALLMIDIDDFKRINDTRGHLEGDHTLHDVADLLRQSVRIFDVCARFGGEEFAIVMPGASASVAMQVAERIRARVDRHFSHESFRVTVSVGVGMFEIEQGSHELIEAADRALMAAKAAGKNIVWIDSQLRSRIRQIP
jgi:diguanylate cyclase (GGDEF)-like protein